MSESNVGDIQQESGAPHVVETKEQIDFRKDMLRYKDELALAKQKLDEYRLQEEESKGNQTKVIEELKEKSRNQEAQLKKERYMFAKTNIENAVKQEALKFGCKDANAFLRLIGAEKLKIVGFDEGFNPNMQDINMIVNDAMKEFEHIGLFAKKVHVADGIPSKQTTEEKKVDLSKLTWKEATELASKLK